MLGAAPFLLLQDEQEIANQIAEYAFYFLVFGIFWKFIQYFIRGQHEDEIQGMRMDARTWIMISPRGIQASKKKKILMQNRTRIL